MTDINLDNLLKDISPEAPSGESGFDNDPEFFDLERKIQGTPEQEFGGEIVQEAKGPKWREIKDGAIKLLDRCHDLQVAVFLTRALLHTQGLRGLKTGLELMCGYIEHHWATLYPQLDPDDGNDPIQRMNIFASLEEYSEFLSPLMEAPLCESPRLGKYCYRDVLIALGKITATKKDKDPSPNMNEIEAAFKDADDSKLSEDKAALSQSLQLLNALKAGLREKAGAEFSSLVPDFKKLHEILTEMDALMLKHSNSQKKEPSPESDSEPEMASGPSDQGPRPSSAPVATGPVTNRQDVIRLLDLICTYYQNNEPGSPIPLILQRARQLVDKNFMEIMQDLAPDAAGKMKNLIIGGDDKK